MSERWLPIPGHEGRYEVSDLGNVRSLIRGGRMLKGSFRKGYRVVGIGGRSHLVHRLVLTAFVGPCPPGKETAHGNGLRADNRLANLRWATNLENCDDREAHGRLAVAMAARRKRTRENLKSALLGKLVEGAQTHCKNGHLLIGGNLAPRADGLYHCRTCFNASHRRRRARNALARAQEATNG